MSTRKIVLQTFGYHHGKPPLCDFTFNCRNVPNPSAQLRKAGYTGLHKKLQESIFANKRTEQWYQNVLVQVAKMLQENQDSIILGFGCAYGKHRSVAIVERLFRDLYNFVATSAELVVQHRDVEKPSKDK